MFINNDYIIKHWNISYIKNIDFTNSSLDLLDNIPVLHLKLLKNIECCPRCLSKNIFIKGGKTQIIKHALQDLSFAVIKFHKRTYKCKECNHIFSESLGNFVSAREISFFLNLLFLRN